ncbi:peptidogalycan biosysnthesis protein [Micromonospora sp. B11E3]|uniref:peptidogalycan biosysnthesis protein n=1 Tax=Micromonospora sp. B11E3 TaxID=3153562 RepID=UPI00325EABD8
MLTDRTELLTPRVPAAWDSLATAWPVEVGTRWLRAEHGRVSPTQFVTIVEDDAAPVAAASWLLLTGAEERRGYSAYDLVLDCGPVPADDGDARRLAALRRRLPASAVLPCASVVMPGTDQPAIVWDRDREPRVRQSALARLVAAVTRAARRTGARGVAFANVPAGGDWQVLRVALAEAGFAEAVQPPSVELALPAGGIAEYLDRLPRARRKKCRREMRAFADAVSEVRVYDADRLCHDDIVGMLHDRYVKYGHASSPASVRDRMRRAQDLPGVTVLVAERDGRACGFKAFVVDVPLGRVVSRFGGFLPNDYFGYFNLAYYEPIRYAAGRGLATMTLGTGSYAAKVARGAGLESRSCYVDAADPAVATLLGEACTTRSALERRRLADELGTNERWTGRSDR